VMRVTTLSVLLFVFLVWAQTTRAQCEWAMYKQCDQKWANDRLGNSAIETICDAGSGLTVVAMILRSHNLNVTQNVVADPLNLNGWLTANAGFSGKDQLIWASIAPLGLKLFAFTPKLPKDEMKKLITKCQAIAASVEKGSHWVYLTGWNGSDDNEWFVNDPGREVDTYEYTDFNQFVVFSTIPPSIK